MKKLMTLLTLFATSFAFSQDEKPKLHLYLYEQADDVNTEVVFFTEFSCLDPIILPHVRALGIASAFAQAAAEANCELTQFFKETIQPRDLSSHISSMNKSIRLRFILPEHKIPASLSTLIDVITVMPTQIGNCDRSVLEETKEELIGVLPHFDNSEIHTSELVVAQLFETLPLDSLNDFMKDNFLKGESHLIIAYPQASKQLIEEILTSLTSQWDVDNHSNAHKRKVIVKSSEEDAAAKAINKEGGSVIVDGKIYMDPPTYWQEEATARGSGAALLVFGILLMLFTFGLSFIVLGVPGIVLLCDVYLADPAVIERKRVEIFQHGYYYANAQQCVSLALTPLERRQLFVQDIYQRYPRYVKRIKDFAAYYALNVYNYKAREMKQFLYPEERAQLKQFQANFNSSLGGLDREIRNLKRELNNLLAPYRSLRDTEILYAQIRFNASQYGFNDPNYNTAYSCFLMDLSLIQSRYNINKNNCKLAIHYDARMADLQNGEWTVYSHYSELVSQYIMQHMIPNDPNFADILDLRAANI